MGRQWNVYRAGLDPTFGHEQKGEIPALVVSAEPLNGFYEVVTVIPITSRKGDRPARLGEVLLPAGTAGLPLDSIALCYQARAVETRRLLDLYGAIADDSLRRAIADTLSECLDLPYAGTLNGVDLL